MNASVFGAVSQNVSAVVLSVALPKGSKREFHVRFLTLGRFFP
jgi:hypothetical protein